jgi:arsenate reductase (thioredoxin)
MPDRIVFLCPYAAAKSVMAAAYCQRLADQWGVSLHITSAGTEPDAELAPAVVALLRAEGIDVSDQRPRRVTAEELAAASCIISLGCDLSDLARPGMPIERWDDVPAPSQDLQGARDRIRDHIEQLIVRLKQASPSPASL